MPNQRARDGLSSTQTNASVVAVSRGQVSAAACTTVAAPRVAASDKPQSSITVTVTLRTP